MKPLVGYLFSKEQDTHMPTCTALIKHNGSQNKSIYKTKIPQCNGDGGFSKSMDGQWEGIEEWVWGYSVMYKSEIF